MKPKTYYEDKLNFIPFREVSFVEWDSLECETLSVWFPGHGQYVHLEDKEAKEFMEQFKKWFFFNEGISEDENQTDLFSDL